MQKFGKISVQKLTWIQILFLFTNGSMITPFVITSCHSYRISKGSFKKITVRNLFEITDYCYLFFWNLKFIKYTLDNTKCHNEIAHPLHPKFRQPWSYHENTCKKRNPKLFLIMLVLNLSFQSCCTVSTALPTNFECLQPISGLATKARLLFRTSHFSFLVFGHFWWWSYENIT